MATYYINPDYTVNGDGTAKTQAAGAGQTGAYNTWSGVAINAGNHYLQKAGTTETGVNLTINQTATEGNEIVVGSYTDATDRSYAGSTRPVLDGTGAGSVNGVLASGKEYYIIEDLEIRNFTSRGIQNIANSTRANNGAIIRNCHVHNNTLDGINFAQTTGDTDDPHTNILVQGCIVHDNGDFGISFYNAAEDCTVRDCTAYSNGSTGNQWDIWFGARYSEYTSGWTNSSGTIYYRAFTLTVLNVMQTTNQVNLAYAGSATTTPGSGEWSVSGGNLYINTGAATVNSNTIIVQTRENKGALIEGCTGSDNLSTDGTSIGIDTFAEGTIRRCIAHNTPRGLVINNTYGNCVIENCIVINCSERGVGLGRAPNVTLRNNTIVDCVSGIFMAGTEHLTTDIVNNIIYGGTYGLEEYGLDGSGSMTGYTESHNCMYGQATDDYRNGTPDASDVTSDPLIDDNGFPASTSPCLNAGIPPASQYDAYSRPNYGSHIGAVWPKINTSKTRRSF